MSLFSWFRGGDPLERNRVKMEQLEESQQFLIDAAVAINDVAGALTEQIRKRYESDMRFEATSNIIEDALIICALDGTVQHANAAATRDFGRDLHGAFAVDLFRSVQPIVNLPQLFDLMREPASTLFGCNRDGSTFVVNPKLERLEWQDGTSSMMMLIRKASEHEIRDLIDLSFDAILVVRDDHIVAANPSIERVFGYDSSSLMGQPLANLFPKERPERLKDTGIPVVQHVVGTHDDGRALNLKFAALHIGWDNVTARLITLKPHVEIDNERYDLKSDNGVDMIVCFDTSGKITFANSTYAKVYNKTRKEVMSMHMNEILSPREFEILRLNMNAMSLEKPTLRVQLQHEKDNGTPSAIHDWIWHAIFDSTGNIVEFQRTGRDISEIVSNIVTAGYF